MTSAAAARFNAACRPRMFALHGEIVKLLRNVTDDPQDLTVIWQRGAADAPQTPDGLGAQDYRGEAQCVALFADLPTAPGPQATITRNDEIWTVRHAQRQDADTWILHLSRQNDKRRMPGRGR